MKRRFAAIFILVILALALAGCSSGKVVEVKVILTNATDYELSGVGFQIPPTRGTTSPMHDLITKDDAVLMPGETREVSAWIFKRDLGSDGWSYIHVVDDETKYTGHNAAYLYEGVTSYEITCEGDKAFFITKID